MTDHGCKAVAANSSAYMPDVTQFRSHARH